MKQIIKKDILKSSSKIFIFASFFLILMLIAGCGPAGGSREPINYRVGFGGVDVVVSGLPKYPITVNDTFLVQVDVENNGAYDIKDGYQSVFMEPKNYFTLIEEAGISQKDITFATDSEPLQGVGEFHPFGGKIPQPFIYKYTAGEISSAYEQEFNFNANVCYKYETIVETLACVGPRPQNLESPEPFACDLDENNDLYLENGQGAPIAITELTEELLPGGNNSVKPRFLFSIKNFREGATFSVANTAEQICKSPTNWNKIDFEIYLSADYKYDSANRNISDFDCGTRDFRLTDNVLNVECTLKKDVAVSYAYYSPLIIKLKYVYAESFYAPFKVRSPEYR